MMMLACLLNVMFDVVTKSMSLLHIIRLLALVKPNGTTYVHVLNKGCFFSLSFDVDSQ